MCHPMLKITKQDKFSKFADSIEFIVAQGADGYVNHCCQALQVLIQSNCDSNIVMGAFMFVAYIYKYMMKPGSGEFKSRKDHLNDLVVQLKQNPQNTLQNMMHTFLHQGLTHRTIGQHNMNLEMLGKSQFESNCYIHNVYIDCFKIRINSNGKRCKPILDDYLNRPKSKKFDSLNL